MRRRETGFRTISILSILFCCMLTAAANAGTPQAICKWAGTAAKADGNLDEWKGMPTTFFEDERLILGISNDSDFLYLFFRTDNIDLIRTIRMTGLKLWLDPKGKKKKDLEFHFRGGPSMTELTEAGLIDTSRSGGRMRDGMTPMLPQRDKGDIISLTDKRLDLKMDIPADGTQGPIVRYSIDKGYCIYEFAIPLQDHLVDYYGFDAEPGREIGIGAQWGGRPEREMRGDDPAGGMGGMPPGGMGGGRGGMSGPPGRQGGRMQMPDEKEVWVRATLAVSQTDQNDGK